MINPVEVETSIIDLSKKLRKLNLGDNTLLTRLEKLREMIAKGHHRMYASLGINSLLNPDHIETKINQTIDRSKLLSILEWVRNVLVLIPILLTWFALWQASTNYQALIESSEELIDQPFLIVWQEGFEELGKDNWWQHVKFSQVALGDAFIIGVIVLVTMVIHYYRDIEASRIARKAVEIRVLLESVLWDVGCLFAQAHIERTATTSPTEDAQKLIEEAIEERQRIEDFVEQNQGELIKAIVKSSEESDKRHQEFVSTMERLRSRMDALGMIADETSQCAKTTRVTAASMEDMLKKTRGIERAINNESNRIGEFTQQVQKLITAIEEISKRLVRSGETGSFSTMEQPRWQRVISRVLFPIAIVLLLGLAVLMGIINSIMLLLIF